MSHLGNLAITRIRRGCGLHVLAIGSLAAAPLRREL